MRFPLFRSRLSRGTIVALGVMTLATARPALGQETFTGRILAGAFMPSGELKDWYTSGGVIGVEGTYRLSDRFAGTASSSWANSGSMRPDGIPAQAMAWTMSLGGEAKIPGIDRKGQRWALTPYAGVGASTRAYYFQTYGGSTTGFGGYGAIGADLLPVNRGGLGVRAEIRASNVTFTDPRHSIARKSGMDLMLTLGLSWF
jgi:hypothetical protein